MRELAASPRPAARALAATVLGQLGVPVVAFPRESAEALEGMAVEEGEHAVLAAVATALGHLGEPHGTATLVALHRHPDAEVRDAVAGALIGRSDPAAREALGELAADQDPRIRAWAAISG